MQTSNSNVDKAVQAALLAQFEAANAPGVDPVHKQIAKGMADIATALSKQSDEIARLKALLAEASEALTPFALAASHQMILAQAAFSRAAVVWEKLDAAR